MSGAIALIGPMGAGKSVVGRALAERLGRPFVDTDEIVERQSGETIVGIFSGEGEPGFRVREAAAVQEAVRIPEAVIACGGGVVLDPSNVEALRSAGVVVYLRVTPEVAARRIGGDGRRPLLTGALPEARLAELIGQRASAYEAAAHHAVDADEPPQVVLASLLTALAP